MKKLNKKGLSPVIAAIILVAVTVALAIGVATWMGALTFGFMGTEQLKITDATFNASGCANMTDLSVSNIGTTKVVVSALSINGVGAKLVTGPDGTLQDSVSIDPGTDTTIHVMFNDNSTFTEGKQYEFVLQTSRGNRFNYLETW